MPRVETRSTDAKHIPVLKGGGYDSTDNETGGGNERKLRSQGDAKDALDSQLLIGIDDKPVDMEKLDMLAFMNEPITIRIGTTTDKNAAQIFEVQVNQTLELFRRGETKTVKRYIVDKLLRTKQTIYTQREVTNNEGIKDIINVPHTALLYDFQVVRDDNPKGADWLSYTQAEAG